MKQHLFEQQHRPAWEQFEQLLQLLEKGKRRSSASHKQSFASDYRHLCQHLALAQDRAYSSHLIDYLQQLALRGHQQLYRHHGHIGHQVISFILAGFPHLIRTEWRSVAMASLIFYGPFLLMGTLVYFYPDLIYSLMEPGQVDRMSNMYDPDARRIGRFSERDASDDWYMFGYYIMNNIGIGFQTFASGIVFGLGTLFFLMFNGLTIGAVAGYLTQIGYSETFWSFVIGHGAFELTAITFAGAAGFKLGWALLAPGRLKRSEALRLAAASSIKIIAGVIFFLLIAAFVEAYWSSIRDISPMVKYSVGALLWLLVALYFIFAGRRQHAPN